MTMFSDLAETVALYGGFTLDVREMSHPETGWVVSTHPEFEHTVRWVVSASDIAEYLFNHVVLLHEPGKLMGVWLDRESGITYLDVVSIVPTFEGAVALAAKYGQLAVYHLDTATEIRIESDTQHAA